MQLDEVPQSHSADNTPIGMLSDGPDWTFALLSEYEKEIDHGDIDEWSDAGKTWPYNGACQ